jgi:hypothetical protein
LRRAGFAALAILGASEADSGGAVATDVTIGPDTSA